MIVKKTKQLGNFKRGINLYVPRRRSSSAPSGINVATTNAIVLSGITGVYSDLNGTYTKSGDPTSVTAGGVDGEATGAVFFNSAYIGGNKYGAAIWYGPILFGSGNGWQITWYNDNRFRLGSIESADTTTVPVSGYSNFAGYTGTITLTAVPSGIAVATTNAVNISGNNNVVPDGTYTKVTTTLTRVAGSLVSSKLFLDTGLVYLKEAGFGNDIYAGRSFGHILIAPNATFQTTLDNPLPTDAFWRSGRVFDNEDGGFEFFVSNNNSSTDATIIPTSGWDYAITITAA
jgi:hypothetical protein